MYKYKIELNLINSDDIKVYYADDYNWKDGVVTIVERNKTYQHWFRYIISITCMTKEQVEAEQNQLALASLEREQQIQLEIAELENEIKGAQ